MEVVSSSVRVILVLLSLASNKNVSKFLTQKHLTVPMTQTNLP